MTTRSYSLWRWAKVCILLLIFSSVHATSIYDDPEILGDDWLGIFYDNIHFSGAPAADGVIYPGGLYFNWQFGRPKDAFGSDIPVSSDNFSAVFISYQMFNTADYTFIVRANDGVRVYIDGHLVLDEMSVVLDVNFFDYYEFSYPMTAGQHQIRVEYVEYTGLAMLHFQWSRTNDVSIYYGDERYCFAPGQTDAAVYNNHEGGISIYSIDANAQGTVAIALSQKQLAALPEKPAQNTRIGTARRNTIQLYKLDTGEYQVNVGPDLAGKTYVCIMDTIPPKKTAVSAFELYPR